MIRGSSSLGHRASFFLRVTQMNDLGSGKIFVLTTLALIQEMLDLLEIRVDSATVSLIHDFRERIARASAMSDDEIHALAEDLLDFTEKAQKIFS